MNIIITNIGRRGYLVEFLKKMPGMTGKVYTSDCDITASGLYGNNDGHFLLPKPVDDEELYIDALIKKCKEYDIRAVIPVIDPEIYILSGYKGKFSDNGICVVVSERQVLDICFDKLKMNEFLAGINVHYPQTYDNLQAFYRAKEKKDIDFPVIIKPILGSGSVDTYMIEDKGKLDALFVKGMIIQEVLEGTEYGTDTFNTFEGIPIRCVIKRKISMRSGETDKSISVHNTSVQDVLLTVAKELKHIGNLDCDIIVSKGIPYVIDMNPRFGGGYPATHAIGVNLIEILYRLMSGEHVEPEFENYPDDVLVMKEIAVRSVVVHEIGDKIFKGLE